MKLYWKKICVRRVSSPHLPKVPPRRHPNQSHCRRLSDALPTIAMTFHLNKMKKGVSADAAVRYEQNDVLLKMVLATMMLCYEHEMRTT